MLHIVKGFDRKQTELLDLAFRFRHEAFVEEAGWENLRRKDGREFDQFDTADTIHIIAMKYNCVQAYSRLNPTTKPHVLSEIYPELASRGLVQENTAWEWSRMGTAKKARNDGRGWTGPIGLLFRCVTYTALKHDIETLIWQAHPVWISRASELGFSPYPLGLPQRILGERVVAARMAVNQEVFATMDIMEVPNVDGLPNSRSMHA
jgi:acyl-homoserine lactone synthase